MKKADHKVIIQGDNVMIM